jgi:tetraprenyl-beta-curcumene synthase
MRAFGPYPSVIMASMLATLRTLQTLAQYETSIVPHARAEIRRWAAVADTIPDPLLRAHATTSIAVDASNAEAVAAFAALAPRQHRRTTIELLVAYQILVDYVDALGERVCAHDLTDGLRIGKALAAAVSRSTLDAIDPHGDDGGYLSSLISACRSRLWRLPAAPVVHLAADAAAHRCGQALAHSHTAGQSGELEQLKQWTAQQPDTEGYEWWEIAAGGNSSIAILALLGAAADPDTTSSDTAQIQGAYWPHLCAMSTLLDSLIDYERDAQSGDFSFVSHYPDHDAARRGLVRATERCLHATRSTRRSHIHMMIVCGVAAYYATGSEHGSLAQRIAPHVVDALRPTITPIVAALRAQRRLKR